jgi:hypothetical protein
MTKFKFDFDSTPYLWRIVIASASYRFRLLADIIASDGYRSEVTGQRYRLLRYLFEEHTQALSLLGK